MKNIFITGIYRSGTTLLDKLLNNHEKVFVASQPYPELYYSTKRAFLESKGIKKHYPMDSMLLEEEYTLKEFLGYLVNTTIDDDFLQDVQDEVANNTNEEPNWSKYNLKEITRKGDFFTIHRQLINLLSKVYKRSDLSYTGSKEIICEEYIPYMAREGNKAILVIRDPKDVISSLSFGKARVYTGDYRPMLYSLRLWRKSVAFAIASETNPDFMMVKYEDLVTKPTATLRKVTKFLELDEFPEDAFVYGIEDQYGMNWGGNSSFGMKANIDSSSIGIHRSVLKPEQVTFIETVCEPELKFLGYQTGPNRTNFRKMENLTEPAEVMSQGFEKDYSFSEKNIDIEKERLQKLWIEGLSEEEARKWFIFPSVFEKLRMQKVEI